MAEGMALNAILDRCDELMDDLETKCCTPGRAPRMQALRLSLADIANSIAGFDGTMDGARGVIYRIEEAGAQIGSLQVSCCAPARMPLYEELLKALMTIQRSTKRLAKLAHDES